eukprot:GFUD01003094.1.p1 GENE.GFUD01003094.1~~GFUD01003094.1.p1  ORF type:complete len:686 (-),score=156.66 GFUD01003094.1:42-2099(-)
MCNRVQVIFSLLLLLSSVHSFRIQNEKGCSPPSPGMVVSWLEDEHKMVHNVLSAHACLAMCEEDDICVQWSYKGCRVGECPTVHQLWSSQFSSCRLFKTILNTKKVGNLVGSAVGLRNTCKDHNLAPNTTVSTTTTTYTSTTTIATTTNTSTTSTTTTTYTSTITITSTANTSSTTNTSTTTATTTNTSTTTPTTANTSTTTTTTTTASTTTTTTTTTTVVARIFINGKNSTNGTWITARWANQKVATAAESVIYDMLTSNPSPIQAMTEQITDYDEYDHTTMSTDVDENDERTVNTTRLTAFPTTQTNSGCCVFSFVGCVASVVDFVQNIYTQTISTKAETVTTNTETITTNTETITTNRELTSKSTETSMTHTETDQREENAAINPSPIIAETEKIEENLTDYDDDYYDYDNQTIMIPDDDENAGQPISVPNPTELEMNVSQTIRLRCQMENRNIRLRELVLIWRKDGDIISVGCQLFKDAEGRYRLLEENNGNILKIDPGLASDAGVYTCEVASPLNDQIITRINVTIPTQTVRTEQQTNTEEQNISTQTISTNIENITTEPELFTNTETPSKITEPPSTNTETMSKNTETTRTKTEITTTNTETTSTNTQTDPFSNINMTSNTPIEVIPPSEQKGSMTAMQIVAVSVLILVSLALVVLYVSLQRQKKFTYRIAERHVVLKY